MDKKVRVRFAPSPTGPLHIGGVRTALYNYLFANKMNGTFILRIEDTDQKRYVPKAEEYIIEALNWFGLKLDEGPGIGGNYGPYRQSERKDIYGKYALALVEKGFAYYAFDTGEELEQKRKSEEEKGNQGYKYNHATRAEMRNSLTLSPEETKALIEKGENVTIRLKIPVDETITFTDKVRGEVSFDSNLLDDKVILKNDGMPTYHLANIIDDHLMEISHVIRGEEWLSSTAHHVIMYKYFGWEAPEFSHLPLLLNPTGKGKLSKRHGAKFGFPVFPLEWNGGEEVFEGFRERGFDPKAVINFLAFLGWSTEDDKEMYTMDELIQAFSLERIVKSGARFDFEKALWYNQQYLIKADNNEILAALRSGKMSNSIANHSDDFMVGMIDLMKERAQFYDQIITDGQYFLTDPTDYDIKTLKKKYKSENQNHLDNIKNIIADCTEFNATNLSTKIKNYISENELSFGAILPILRIFISGTLKGPDIFEVMGLLGKETILSRWAKGEDLIANLSKE